MEKLALMLDGAAQAKLEVEGKEKEQQAKQQGKEAAAAGQAVADKLRADGCEELAEMVEQVVKEVEHALSGDVDVAEVEQAIADAKAAAAKLREEGKEEEAEQMEAMVVKLEAALKLELEAEDKLSLIHI